MSGFSYPQPTFISPIYNPAFYLSLDASGYLTYDYAQTLYLGKNNYRLTYITGITPGTATPGVSLVVGNDGGLSGLGALSCSSLTVNGSSIVSAPAYVQSITPGTAANSKALVLYSSGAIGTIASLTATSITGTLQTAAQTNITSIGTLTGLTIDGNLTFTGTSRTVTGLNALSATNITGTLQIAGQPNISSIGTLTALTIGGNLTFTGASITLTGLNYIDATSFRQTGVAYDISLVSRLALTTLGTCEASKAIVLDSTRSCSNIYGMTFDSGGTGLNIPALSFGGTVFNQSYYINITEGSAANSKAVVLNSTKDFSGIRNLSCTGTFTSSTSLASPKLTTSEIAADTLGELKFSGSTSYISIANTNGSLSSTTGALRCAGGAYFGANCLFALAITATDIYGSIRTSSQSYITSLGTQTSLSTSGDITCGGNLKGFLSYGNQTSITSIGTLTELAIGSSLISNEYLRITGSGSDYLDGSYTRMVRCVGSNATSVEFQIEVNNGSNATSTNASWIGNRTNNDLRFGVNDTTAMILTAGGRLGIGTASPNVPLHVPVTTSISYDNGSTMVYRLRTVSGVTEMALGPILYDTSAIFGGYLSCAVLATTSDRRLKRNIQKAPIDRIKRLYDDVEVVLYEWIPSEKRSGQEVGLIAQDLVKAHLTDLVSVFHRDGMPKGEDPVVEPADTQLNVDYSRIAAYNMKMIQHLLAEIEELKRRRTCFSCHM